MEDSKIIKKYFPDLEISQIDLFTELKAVFLSENQKVNLISRKDYDNFFIHHVLHSLAIAKYRNLSSYSEVVDIGTGGGFPALPLSIMYPNTTFIAVDSVNKKIESLKSICKALNINNLDAARGRVEELGIKTELYITRAVAKSEILWQWVKKDLKYSKNDKNRAGIIALKGGDLERELDDLSVPFIEQPIRQWYSEEFFQTKKIIHIYPI